MSLPISMSADRRCRNRGSNHRAKDFFLGDGHVIGVTLAKTVGLHIVALSRAFRTARAACDQVAPSSMPAWISFWIFSHWVLLTTGPSWALPFGSPTVVLSAASWRRRWPRPSALEGTSMRVGALQDWPGCSSPERMPLPRPWWKPSSSRRMFRALAAQFLSDALDGRGGGLGHRCRRGWAGEGDHVDARVRGDRGAHFRAVPLMRLKTPAGTPAACTTSAQMIAGNGALFRQLPAPWCSRGDGRDDLAGDLVDLASSRGDQAADADRLLR